MKGTLHFSLLFALFFILTGCKKENKNTETSSSESNRSIKGPPHLRERVHVLDTINFILDADSLRLLNGSYHFTLTGNSPNFLPGDIIVGAQGNGFIRKINTFTLNGNTLDFQTTQGSMADVFSLGSFNFDLNLGGMQPGSPANGFSCPISNYSLFKNSNTEFLIEDALVEYNSEWNLSFSFATKGLNKFEMNPKNGLFKQNIQTKLISLKSTDYNYERDTLKQLSKHFVQWVLADDILVPIPIDINMSLVCQFNGNSGDSVFCSTSMETNSNLNFTFKNEFNAWSNTYNTPSAKTFTTSAFDHKRNINLVFSLIPKISISFFGLETISIEIAGQEGIYGKPIDQYSGWGYYTEAWNSYLVKANAKILDFKYYGDTDQKKSFLLTYKAPATVLAYSGNNQIGPAGKELPEPLKIKVVDIFNIPQADAVVQAVKSGNGSISPARIITDKDGIGQFTWTLGPYDEQEVEIWLYDQFGNIISTTVFNATIKE